MKENEHLAELEKKINIERQKLDHLVLYGMGKDELLDLSCKLDELINEYYQVIFDNKKDSNIKDLHQIGVLTSSDA